MKEEVSKGQHICMNDRITTYLVTESGSAKVLAFRQFHVVRAASTHHEENFKQCNLQITRGRL